MTKHSLFLAALTSALTIVTASPSPAQVTTGTIVGTVSDSNGVVPGANVTIREVNKGTSDTFITDGTGTYTAPFLTPGTYAVEVNVQSFKKWIREGVVLEVNQRARVDVLLEVGGIEETTTVVASAPLLRTDSSEIGTVIDGRYVQNLPLNTRNFATLVYAAPGVTPGQAGENLSGASTFNPRGASNFNALGHQANANGWLIDGIDNNEYHLQHRHRGTVNRTGARVQGAHRRLLGRVRSRRRCRLCFDQVRHQHAAWHGIRVLEGPGLRCPELLPPQDRRRAGPQSPVQQTSIRSCRRGRASRSGVVPTGTAAPSSSPTTRA